MRFFLLGGHSAGASSITALLSVPNLLGSFNGGFPKGEIR